MIPLALANEITALVAEGVLEPSGGLSEGNGGRPGGPGSLPGRGFDSQVSVPSESSLATSVGAAEPGRPTLSPAGSLPRESRKPAPTDVASESEQLPLEAA